MNTTAGNRATVVGDGARSRARYIARQPIFDRGGRVHAYELLFRAGKESSFRGDGDLATRTMLDNSVLFGVTELTGGPPAFVNCTLDSLTERLVEVLPPRDTILEILESLEVTAELVEICRKLKLHGFKIALDDFEWKPRVEPLIELADYIKIDFVLSDASVRKVLLHRLHRYAVTLLAEKVESQEEYEHAIQEGFTLFQGYYFCRPSLLVKRELPANKLAQMKILQELSQEPMSLHRVSRSVERDPAITYRLLRLVNSPIYAMRQDVRSVESALISVGEQAFRRIATLAIASAMNAGKSSEILRMAFVRARFCELAAHRTNRNVTEQYLLGLFSLLPTMLEIGMADAIESLALPRNIREALLGTPVRERALLDWMEANEQGDWLQCDDVARNGGLDPLVLEECAAAAMEWADETLRSTAQ